MACCVDANGKFEFSKREILFDTNVWMSIENFGPNVRLDEQRAYSALLAEIRASDCTLLTNDYVLGEFHNRCCRLEYEIFRLESDAPEKFPSFKAFRSTEEFRDRMETVRDTCLSILEDSLFVPVQTSCDMKAVLEELTVGRIDYSDALLREHCKERGVVLVTNDADFLGCGVDIITVNRWMLRKR